MIATAMSAVAIFFYGCATPKPTGPSLITTWSYAPESIEIHPLSRYSADDELIVHIELLDGDSFACRGIGTLELVVRNSAGTIIRKQTSNLEDPAINRALFDGVTRTYKMRLPELTSEANKFVLRASFTRDADKTIKSKTHTIEKN